MSGRRTSLTTASSSASSSSSNQQEKSSERNSNEIDLLDEVDSIFDCLDKNGDGQITPDELKMHLVDEMGYSTTYTEYLFDTIDTDSNGWISREELGFAFYNFEALSMYMTLGMGGSDLTKRPSFQKLLLSENSTKRDRLLLDDLADLIFDMIDADGSGEISKDELREHFEGVTKKLGEGSGGAATVEQANEYVKTMFATLDVDQDGTICRDEVRAAFEKYDFKLLARTFGLRVYQSTN